MRLRWPKCLPGYPAILLVPAVLAGWAVLCFVPPADWILGGGWELERTNGFPFEYTVVRIDTDPTGSVTVTIWIQTLWHLLVLDAVLAATTAWLFPLAVDRLVFPAIQAARRRKRGRGEAS